MPTAPDHDIRRRLAVIRAELEDIERHLDAAAPIAGGILEPPWIDEDLVPMRDVARLLSCTYDAARKIVDRAGINVRRGRRVFVSR